MTIEARSGPVQEAKWGGRRDSRGTAEGELKKMGRLVLRVAELNKMNGVIEQRGKIEELNQARAYKGKGKKGNR